MFSLAFAVCFKKLIVMRTAIKTKKIKLMMFRIDVVVEDKLKETANLLMRLVQPLANR